MSGPKTREGWSWVDAALGVAPTALGLVGALLLGLIGAAVARRVVAGFIDRSGLEVAAEKAGAARVLYKIGVRGGVAAFGGRVAGWVVWGVALYAGLSQLGLDVVNRAIAGGVAMLPQVAAAGVIMGAGALGAGALRKVVMGGQDEEEAPSRAMAARVSSWVLLALVASMALGQLGVAVDLVNRLITVLFGALALGAAVWFALAARAAFGNVFARHYAMKLLRVGDGVRAGEWEGVVRRFLPQSIELATEEGDHVLVPYATLMGQAFTFDPIDDAP